MIRSLFFITMMLFLAMNCANKAGPIHDDPPKQEKEIIKGLSLVAPPSPFDNNPMTAIQQVNADWIAVIPYAFCKMGTTDVVFNVEQQWWGEKEVGVRETIRLAKEAGLKVMLKPQVWVPGSWPGGIEFKNDEDWEKWEASYKEYIMHYTNMTKSIDVDMICIGTEFKQSEVKRAKSWRSLIRDIRKVYDGKLTYAANWDCYQYVPFWNELDYIGVDAYFPLDESKTPTQKNLMKKWKPIHQEFQKLHKKFKKPILFTEFGYLSVDGCAGKTWELEKQASTLPHNQQAQANALDALFDFFEEQPYWEGGFLWKWYPTLGKYQDHGDNGHTPQGKMAEETVRDWYKKL